MKYYKTLKCYKASNFYFSPETMHATSYSWYDLVKKINGMNVLNTYVYSSSTSKHINKVRRLASELGIKFDLELNAPRGLQSLDRSLEYYSSEIRGAKEYLLKPRIRQTTKDKLEQKIKVLNTKLAQVKMLMGENSAVVKDRLGVI